MMKKNNPKIIVALDFDNQTDTLNLAQQLSPAQCRLKVGKELFTSCGPQLIEALHQLGFEVFLDLKFHDIPNTVAKACKAAANLGIWMVNVHASGGLEMMQAAKAALDDYQSPPLLISVTVLTSMSPEALKLVGVQTPLADQVIRLAKLTQQAQLDGVVCSALEAPALKATLGKDFTLVTPGIRLPNAEKDDQTRIVTPTQAIHNGSDYLVIGRPITKAPDPTKALQAIHQQLLSIS